MNSLRKELLPYKYRHNEPIGEEIQFNHEECGDKRNRLYVTRTVNGWLHHCHNCAPKMSGFTRRDGLAPPKETLSSYEKLQKDQLVTQGEVRLPRDFTTEIPDRGLLWLYKYGITDEEITRFKFGYSDHYNRLILTVYSDSDELLYWQGRNLGEISKKNPKYINVKSGGRDVWFRIDFRGVVRGSHIAGVFSPSVRGEEDSDQHTPISDHNACVVVEDILSTIKVGRVTSAIGLLGSYIPTSLTKELVKYDKVYIWLDPDKQKEAIQYASRLTTLLCKPVKPILTGLDPKEYNTQQIKEILNETT